MKDLNSLIEPGLGITLTSAPDINDEGQIVANGYTPFVGEHAFLLTPVPEPSTWALIGMAFLALLGWRNRSMPKASPDTQDHGRAAYSNSAHPRLSRFQATPVL
jgi:hypothetical protein